MNVARSLERRLEKLIEGVAGRMFSGKLHPAELAGRLAREADFARFGHPAGPATANLFVISLNPKDLTVDVDELKDLLTSEMEAHMVEEGLRTAGPIEVRLELNSDTAAGNAQCHVEVVPGPGVAWARITGETGVLEIDRNRCLIGRGDDTDVQIPFDDISRHHAVIFREHAKTWISDLGSTNGTTVDAYPVSGDPVELNSGDLIGFASHTFRVTVD